MKRLPTIHRMDRRSEFKNYALPGIYHITVKATETLRSPFGVVVGNIDKPNGDADAPRVALSPVGQMVEQELLHSITAHYPMVEVQDYVIMPEHLHFIVVVKRLIVNSQGRSAHLGQAEPAGMGAGRFRRQGPHHIATLPSLFKEGYCDVMPVDAAPLEQQRAYIKNYRRKDEDITVMECKTMNRLVQALCRPGDDWWKRRRLSPTG